MSLYSKRSLCLSILLVVLAGCGDGDATDTSSVSNNGNAGASAGSSAGGTAASSGSGGAAGNGGAGVGGTEAGGAGVGGAGFGGAGVGGEAGIGGNAGSAGVPDFCGGEAGIPCPAGYFCDFPTNDCGGGDTTGKCQPKPDDSCPSTNPPYPPVCGCDKKVYAGPCEAAMGGTDIASLSNFCEPPKNTFKCGEKFCNLDQYCRVDTSDVASLPTTYACIALPDACLTIDAMPSCQCIKNAGNVPCSDLCKDDGKGAVTVTCPGG